MADEEAAQAAAGAQRFHVQARAEGHFAWIRTRLSAERTMMAWVRTAVALIGFGFTIVQFFERFGGFENVKPAAQSMAPRYVGLVLIASGIAVLLVSAWQYQSFLRYLWSEEFAPIRGWGRAPRQTPAFAVTIGMILVGLFAFLVVLFRAV